MPTEDTTKSKGNMGERGNSKYRDLLQQNATEMIDQFGKTVLTLSSGALGVSFAFIKDVVPLKDCEGRVWLLASWSTWGVSLMAILLAYYFSHTAMLAAIDYVDGKRMKLRSKSDCLTIWLTRFGGFCLCLGVSFLLIFVGRNLLK